MQKNGNYLSHWINFKSYPLIIKIHGIKKDVTFLFILDRSTLDNLREEAKHSFNLTGCISFKGIQFNLSPLEILFFLLDILVVFFMLLNDAPILLQI